MKRYKTISNELILCVFTGVFPCASWRSDAGFSPMRAGEFQYWCGLLAVKGGFVSTDTRLLALSDKNDVIQVASPAASLFCRGIRLRGSTMSRLFLLQPIARGVAP
ncbi:hypothetical protein [Pseudomonas tohonis]|uniref:hypothetical protein n=1 Tax=Pseudomonas tohonis TaxID=2725477 RepID=UPI001F431415|nr:hypothetical protein [Pseudomonas tohonis]